MKVCSVCGTKQKLNECRVCEETARPLFRVYGGQNDADRNTDEENDKREWGQ